MSEPAESRVAEASRPFWEATREKRLVLQWCDACRVPIHYPREMCPRCLGEDLAWRDASGRGVVHAFTVVERAPRPELQERVPYVVALVDLDEGVRLMSNVVSCDPAAVEVGMPVRVAWSEAHDGRVLPVFEPSGGAGGAG